jgi:DNA-binding response OmpR family regulator
MDPRIVKAMTGHVEHPRTFEPVGCDACGFEGYKGRIGLVELLQITPAIREAIGREEQTEGLRALGVSSGALRTMEEDIYHHVQEGHTSVEEVLPFLDFTRMDEGKAETPVMPSPPQPPSPTPPSPGPEPVEEPSQAAGPPRALLAVADGSIRGPLADILLDAELDVTELRNGSEALQHAAKNPIGMLVVDPELPGIDGASLVQAVRGVLGKLDLPILALVSASDAQTMEAMLEAGADDIINTPLVPKMVQARVRGALARKGLWLSSEEVMKPKIPLQEADRMAAVEETGLLDTPPEERFDRITREAQERFGVPVSYVCLVDSERQWFKSKQGLELDETSREVAFCAHAINEEEALVVSDSSLDPRFSQNPLATGPEQVRFYAGVPLRSPEGQAIGTMCIVDHEPRALAPEELEALKGYARDVEKEIWEEG